MVTNDRDYQLLKEVVGIAQMASLEGYAPVAACIVNREGNIVNGIRQSMTRPTGDKGKAGFPVYHAEIELIRSTAKLLDQGILYDAPPYTLYVSLEPCHMCMGAAIVARIGRVVWALDDYWGGATKLYDSGREYLKLRMPELVRTPYPDLQAKAARLWVAHLNQYNLPDYIERMLRWQARLEE